MRLRDLARHAMQFLHAVVEGDGAVYLFIKPGGPAAADRAAVVVSLSIAGLWQCFRNCHADLAMRAASCDRKNPIDVE